MKCFKRVVDLHMILIIFLSVASTYMCISYNMASNMPTSLIGISIVFPVVFSINSAYKRREQALGYFSDFNAHFISLFYAHRDWIPAENNRTDFQESIRSIYQGILVELSTYLKKENTLTHEDSSKIYPFFSKLSKLNEKLRAAGVPANEVSRANQYLKSIIASFEKMKNFSLYRTPLTLKFSSRMFLNIFPILFGPYFAHLAANHYPAIGYLVALVYSVVLVSLDNIQSDIENPFDQNGFDDIKLDIGETYLKIMA
ncbi:hypothetical protein ACFL9U_04060 [Thermodesulfobacteriota bacterium]